MAKTISIIVGIVLIVLGVLGLIGTGFIGAEGMFSTNTLHDLIHLVAGIVLLAVGIWASAKAAMTLKALGIIVVLISIFGFVAPSASMSLLGTNTAVNVLHLVVGLLMAILGFVGCKKSSSAQPMM